MIGNTLWWKGFAITPHRMVVVIGTIQVDARLLQRAIIGEYSSVSRERVTVPLYTALGAMRAISEFSVSRIR